MTQHRPEHVLARADQPEQLLYWRRLLGDAVRVIRRVAEQRVGQLRLAAQHCLRAGRLAHRRHARLGKRADLRACVEARPVDVPVATAVARGSPGLDAGLDQRGAEPGRERRLEDPVTASGRAGRVVKRAQRAVREPVREEVQVVEDDQRPERDRRIDSPANRHREHAVRAELLEGVDVGPVRHLVREPEMTLLVAGDVQDLDAFALTVCDQRFAVRGLDALGRRRALVERVRAGPCQHAHLHTAHAYASGRLPSSWRRRRKRSTTRRLASASVTSPRATTRSGLEARSPPTGCQCAPSAVIVSSGTIAASVTSRPSAANPRLTSGRTAKSSPSMPTPASSARSSSTSPALASVWVIAARIGRPSVRPTPMPAIAFAHEPAPRKRSCVSGRAPSSDVWSTSRGRPARRSSSLRRRPLNSIALVRTTVGSRSLAYSSIATMSGSTKGSPPVTYSSSKPSATASSMSRRKRARPIERRRAVGDEATAQYEHARLQWKFE